MRLPRYKVEMNVKKKLVIPLVEFKCPAGQNITQNLPVVNTSPFEWKVKVLIFRFRARAIARAEATANYK